MNRSLHFFPRGSQRQAWSIGIHISLLLVLLLLCSTRARAQGYGTIVGTVTDPSGAAIPGASVTATATETGVQITVKTNAGGYFVFPTLLPTEYAISVSAAGFATYTQTGIVLQADQSDTVNVKMQIGPTAQTVRVEANTPLVDTTSGTLSQVVNQAQIIDLPLNGRYAANLVTLVAGVTTAPSNGVVESSTKTFPGAVSVTVNGTQTSQANYLLDGGNNVDEMTNANAPFPFPDALQEFSVQTSNYAAQYGQAAGAVVNIVTKSGTEAFHGDAFFFLRNGAFDARNYFATTPDNLHRNQFGGVIGGPVIIPGLSKGKRTQFFFGYQRTTDHQNSNADSAIVPTLAEEGRAPGVPYADFGSLCSAGFNPSTGFCNNTAQQIYNPFTGAGYQLNQIPASALNSASQALQADIPTYSGTVASGAVGGTVHYYEPTIQTYNEYLGRVDHSFSERDHLFGHYYYNDFFQAGIYNPSNLLTYTFPSDLRYQNALLSETHIFTANLLNNLVVNYQRLISARTGPAGSPSIADFGVENTYQPPAKSLNTINISGYFEVAGSTPAIFARNNYTFNDDLHWTKGPHNLTFGAHFELSKYDLSGVFNPGSFTFAAVSLAPPASNPSLNYVNAMANFEMGYMSAFNNGSETIMANRNHFPGIFAQDQWRINRKLTINYGVRWEMFSPWANKIGLGEGTAFSPSNYTAGIVSKISTTLPAGMLVSGDAGMPAQGVNNQYKLFMPRLGFAVDVFGDGRTVVRGGFGMFYQTRQPAWQNQTQAAQAPNTVGVSLTDPGGTNVGGPFSNPYCTGCTPGVGTAGPVTNPFPYTLPLPSNYVFPRPITIYEYDPSGNFNVPVTDAFNLTLEQQLFRDTAMRIAYVGSVSRHELVSLDLNPAVNNGTSLNTNQRRAYNTPPNVSACTVTTGCQANFGSIVEANMSGAGSFNSLQATLEKRLSHGLSLLVNYTWSKAFDDMPYTLAVGNTVDLNAGQSYVYPFYPAGASSWNPPDIRALDRGVSDFDHPNAISISYVYSLPKLQGNYAPTRAVVNGWRFAGIIQHHSGDALTITAGKDVSLTGLDQDRGQRVSSLGIYSRQTGQGTCPATGYCVNYITPGAFVEPTNSGANSGTGFGNVMKGSIRGPGYTDWDAAVIRSFPVYHETTLEFRAEYFDVLNHTILGDPTTSLSSGSFGYISSENASGPRIGQFSLKYVF